MSSPAPHSVDVALHVYGKPLMTAVAICSLLAHSGKWINKIYLIEERKQPNNADFKFIAKHFKGQVIPYRPWFYFGVGVANKSRFKWRLYRHSVRYQYAFEKSDRRYIYVMHNDMIFEKDIIGQYIATMQSGGYAGVGPIGMCWNCPAHYAGLCTSDTYEQYKPSPEEFADLCENFHAPRKQIYEYYRGGREHWPLPECRLNEWSALIDRDLTEPYEFPHFDDILFGKMYLDTAVTWFHHMSNKGLRFKNIPLDGYGTHVWTGKEGEANSGVDTLARKDLYNRGEQMSYEKLLNEFGFTEKELARNKAILDKT